MALRRSWETPEMYADACAGVAEWIQKGKSVQSARFLASLDFQLRANAILIPAKPGDGPVLTRAELAEMDRACTAGESPESFAARVLDARGLLV